MSAPGWTWGAAYAGAFGLSALLALTSAVGGNVAFVAGAAFILSSLVFIGLGGERRMRIVRNLTGVPIAHDPIEPEVRRRQISTGVKVFLLGVATWAPLLWLALR